MKKNIIVAKKLIRLANEIVEAESTNLYQVTVDYSNDQTTVAIGNVKDLQDAILYLYIFAISFQGTPEEAKDAENNLSDIDVDNLDEKAKSKIESYLNKKGYDTDIRPLVVASREDLKEQFQKSYENFQKLKSKKGRIKYDIY